MKSQGDHLMLGAPWEELLQFTPGGMSIIFPRDVIRSVKYKPLKFPLVVKKGYMSPLTRVNSP